MCAKTPHSCFLVLDVLFSGVRRCYHPMAQSLNQNILDFITASEKFFTFIFTGKMIRYFYLNRTQENVSKLFYFANEKPKSIQTGHLSGKGRRLFLSFCFFKLLKWLIFSLVTVNSPDFALHEYSTALLKCLMWRRTFITCKTFSYLRGTWLSIGGICAYVV